MEDITLIIPSIEGGKIYGLEQIKKQKIKSIISYGSNPSENRNKGVAKARTKYVGFINAHSLISRNWKKQVLSFFKKYPEIDIVGGPQLTINKEDLFAKASGCALSSKFGSAGVSSRYVPNKLNLNADETMITSANLICKREVFNKVKFDENIYPGEDPKFIADAKKNNFRVAYSPNIIAFNKRRTSLFLLIKQIFSYGFTRPMKEPILDTIKKPFFLVPSLFLIYLILLPLLVSFNKAFLFPLSLYFILNIIFSIFESIKVRNMIFILFLPWIFLSIHLSYGIGFIAGSLNNFKSKKGVR
jgi:hypothetical protein